MNATDISFQFPLAFLLLESNRSAFPGTSSLATENLGFELGQ